MQNTPNEDPEREAAYQAIPNRTHAAKLDFNEPNQLRCSIIAKRGLEAAYKHENDPETCISDLLGDLRHICDALGLDFAECDERGRGHYIAELGEDREARQLAAAAPKQACQCADNLCPVHKGHGSCGDDATITLYRIDMYDPSGTAFCAACADDALESCVFTPEKRD